MFQIESCTPAAKERVIGPPETDKDASKKT